MPTIIARDLTDVVTRLRRALRRSIRTDYPWEARPMAQIEVLQSVHDTGPVRLGDLADRLNLAQSTVSALVGRLFGDGLLTRDVDARDRRAAVIALTPAAETQLEGWDAAHRRRIDTALLALPAGDRRKIIAAVPALAQLADALDPDGSPVPADVLTPGAKPS